MSDNQEWEAWRNAGELWGRVSRELRFGEVNLFRDVTRISEFLLQWRFKADGKTFGAEYAVNTEELCSIGSIEVLAERIVDHWKSDVRNKLGSDMPSGLGR